MNALLTIHNLQKKFHQRQLLNIENLAIAAAQAYVLTGANGSGKSTLMRILAGLESADAGEVKFNGEAVYLLSLIHI